MQQFGVNVQEAMDHIGNLHDQFVDQFFEQWRHIPVFGGPLDEEIRAYCNMLGNWIRGNDSWSFEVCTAPSSTVWIFILMLSQSERYFGVRGPEIQTSRSVRLSRKLGPKAHCNSDLQLEA